jgi:hypothetical protein
MRALWIVLVVACGSPKHGEAPSSSAELSPALASLAWWLGDWQAESGDTGIEHWVAASGAIYGIALHDGGNFEVMIVDDGEGTNVADGMLRFYAMPGGARVVEFTHPSSTKPEDNTIAFTNFQHDFPKVIGYSRDGDTLNARLSGGDQSQDFRFKRTKSERAPELEQADLAFAKDTAARGIEGWVAAFDAKGAQMGNSGRVEGHDAIRELMGPLLAKTKVEWAPIASSKRGDLGWTVGKATFTGEESWRSTYVTIWKQQTDGSWKVLFDTGRPVQASGTKLAARP